MALIQDAEADVLPGCLRKLPIPSAFILALLVIAVRCQEQRWAIIIGSTLNIKI